MADNMEVARCHLPEELNHHVGSGIAKMGIAEDCRACRGLGALLTSLVIVT